MSDGLNCTQTDADGRCPADERPVADRHFVLLSVPAEYEIPGAPPACPSQSFRTRRPLRQKERDGRFRARTALGTPPERHTLHRCRATPQIKDFFRRRWLGGGLPLGGGDSRHDPARASTYRDAVLRHRTWATWSTTSMNGLSTAYLRQYRAGEHVDLQRHRQPRPRTRRPSLDRLAGHGATSRCTSGPTCYSANIGRRALRLRGRTSSTGARTPRKPYRHWGSSDETAHWLVAGPGATCPRTRSIMICAHAQMFNKKTTMVRRNKNFAAYQQGAARFQVRLFMGGT